MDDCIFCKIVKGEIPCYKCYEDENFIAFLDINPRNKGHTLVIPKEHHRWVWDYPDIGNYFEVVKKVEKAIEKAFGTEWVISQVIGDEVPHAHVWLVPRFENDGHDRFLDMTKIKEFSEEEMKSFAESIQQHL